ncbi:hypothetical protein [uncultured Pseudokineococcus sp.]|uniref:hypothetical protein n=1 Tax=uncultured Pseudokineococcus sp. TaxID=1642928 RepID=UPI002630C0AF|nr:hypothetical protein [uncultured Pseudokineococcus sp.]
MSIETALLGLLGPAPEHDDPQGRGAGPQWSHLVRHLEEEAPAELARWAAALDVPGGVGRTAAGRP